MIRGWLLAAGLATYILAATRDWNVPEPGAVPFGPLWTAGTAAGLLLWWAVRRRVDAVAAIAVGSAVAMALTDVSYLATQGLRDLHLYLAAGDRFAAGQAVYLDRLFTERPADLTQYPFLYPPLTLPVFAALAQVARPVVDVVWVTGSIAAALAVLHWFGVRPRFAVLLLLWPPFFQGIQVGNVAVPLAVLFAIGPWAGAGLVIAAVFKVYNAIAALWLVREGRGRELLGGAVAVAVAALATLPLTGTERWLEWWRGLEWYRASQPLLADYLYGFGLPRYVPEIAALAVAGIVVVTALMAGGREALARLGLATAVASPSLFAHGLIVALPAFLSLRTTALWTVLAITSVAPGIAWWAAIAIGVASWVWPGLRRSPTELDDLHPLPGIPVWPGLGPSGDGVRRDVTLGDDELAEVRDADRLDPEPVRPR